MTKNKPVKSTWVGDIGFYSFQIKVKAMSYREARTKIYEKLAKTNPRKFVNNKTTFIDKEY